MEPDAVRVVLVCWGLATEGMETPEGLEGTYLESFDVDAFDGQGTATWTDDIRDAMVFDGIGEATDAWRTQSTVRPKRDDGRPNRPMTAFNVEPRAVS
jgi:hypothetical protein